MNWLTLLLLLTFSPVSQEYYFRDSDQRLEVIRIHGEKPGPTALIFGGIHGDEPGGYFSSDLLAKIIMHKGNLILVPRVNFPSVMLNRRQLHGDMNRKFLPQQDQRDPDREVVEKLKTLMAEADLFINQHDASGFHRERQISRLYNPAKYGQSLIIDTNKFYSRKLQRLVDLEAIGQRIVQKVNRQIKRPAHLFGFWNHESVLQNTQFPEMRKSATHYALVTFSIPAFGVETSKDLPTLADKVKYQLLVITQILTEFGCEFELPALALPPSTLYWIELLKNGQDIIRVNSHTNLRLDLGDRVRIKQIQANDNSGLSADILNWGSLNDLDKELCFKRETAILIKKNNMVIGKIHLRRFLPASIRRITVQVAGQIQEMPNWGKITLTSHDSWRLLDIFPRERNLRMVVPADPELTIPVGHESAMVAAASLAPDQVIAPDGHCFLIRIYSGSKLAGGFQIEVRPQD